MLIIEGASAAEQDRTQDAWERARWAAMATLQPHLQKGKTLKPSDLAVFEWETPAPAKAIEDEAAKKRKAERAAAWDAKMKMKYGKQD